MKWAELHCFPILTLGTAGRDHSEVRPRRDVQRVSNGYNNYRLLSYLTDHLDVISNFICLVEALQPPLKKARSNLLSKAAPRATTSSNASNNELKVRSFVVIDINTNCLLTEGVRIASGNVVDV